MPGNTVETFELLRHDSHIKVALSLAGTGMALMQVALILDQQFRWQEGLAQQSFDGGCPF
jgi:hypothetical protein